MLYVMYMMYVIYIYIYIYIYIDVRSTAADPEGSDPELLEDLATWRLIA